MIKMGFIVLMNMIRKDLYMIILLLTNNQRKMHGFPLWRKKDKRKRFYTRCNGDEVISGFIYSIERG